MAFIEVFGKIVFFNEAEAVAAITEYDEDESVKQRPTKQKGKRASLIQDLPVVPVSHMMSEEELIAIGIRPTTVRLSIGTEHIDDIIADLQHGFEAVK